MTITRLQPSPHGDGGFNIYLERFITGGASVLGEILAHPRSIPKALCAWRKSACPEIPGKTIGSATSWNRINPGTVTRPVLHPGQGRFFFWGQGIASNLSRADRPPE